MTSSGRVGVVLIGLVPAALAAAVLTACGRGQDEASRQLQRAVAADSAADTHDPCTLLSAGEAAPYVGALAAPPYRASDGAADVRGDECMYRGTDGRQVTVRPDWHGGEVVGGVLRDVPNAIGNALSKAGATGMDTMTHRVMQQGPAGPWDQATWIPGGSLFASSGEAQVSIDVSGASGEERDAVALATLIMPRFDHPLDYDGARAVALAPKPRAHPANACDFMPRPEVEAAIGPLAGAPTSDVPETSCTYRVATAQGTRSYPVAFVWEGGRKNYMMLKHGMATVGGMLGVPSSSPLDTMKPAPQVQTAIGGLMKMVGGASGEGGASAAPGAAATIGFRTDTTLTGPWDDAALLHGTQLIAVRHDVFVGVSLVSADYARAKALLAAICARL
jgi:hypothetical protein